MNAKQVCDSLSIKETSHLDVNTGMCTYTAPSKTAGQQPDCFEDCARILFSMVLWLCESAHVAAFQSLIAFDDVEVAADAVEEYMLDKDDVSGVKQVWTMGCFATPMELSRCAVGVTCAPSI